MNTSNIDISRLKEAREKLKITRMEAAKRIGVAQGTYVRYENGSRIPSIQVVSEIARVFGVSVDYLTGKSKSKKPTRLVIDKSSEPELFSIVELTINSDANTKQRLLDYAKKLASKK